MASFRFSQPYKSLSGAIPVSTSGTLVYNYGKNGYSPALMLGGTRFSSEIISEDRSIISLDPSYSELKPDWWVDPFSTSSIGSASDAKTFNTKTGADALTGVNKSSDTFAFGSPPEYGSLSDKITNFSSKDKDILQFSKSAFGVSVGNFAIAKTQKKLNKVLASDVDIVYNQSKGELIFNANGPEAGFGVDGGVFAQLVGAPKLTAAAVSFI